MSQNGCVNFDEIWLLFDSFKMRHFSSNQKTEHASVSFFLLEFFEAGSLQNLQQLISTEMKLFGHLT